MMFFFVLYHFFYLNLNVIMKHIKRCYFTVKDDINNNVSRILLCKRNRSIVVL